MNTSQVWFFRGLGFHLPPQNPSASLRRRWPAKLLPCRANQACSSQKNTEREEKRRKAFLGEDGAVGSKGRWGWQLGGMAGMVEEGAPAARTEGTEGMEGTEEGGTGGPSAWSLGAASQTLFAFHVSGPGGTWGVWQNPCFSGHCSKRKLQQLCSGLGRVKLTVWKSLFQDPVSHYHFKGKYEFKTFKEI